MAKFNDDALDYMKKKLFKIFDLHDWYYKKRNISKRTYRRYKYDENISVTFEEFFDEFRKDPFLNSSISNKLTWMTVLYSSFMEVDEHKNTVISLTLTSRHNIYKENFEIIKRLYKKRKNISVPTYICRFEEPSFYKSIKRELYEIIFYPGKPKICNSKKETKYMEKGRI